MSRQYPTLGTGFVGIGPLQFFLILAAAADGAARSVLSLAGKASLAAVSGLGFVLLWGILSLRVHLEPFERKLIWLFGLIGLVNVLTFMKSGVSIQGLERIAQIAVISGLVISATLIIRDTNESVHLSAIYIYSIAFALFNTMYIIFLGLPRDFSGVFVNPNVMAMYTLVVFSLLLIVYDSDINDIVSDKLVLICSILLYLIILLTGSRSAFLSVNILLAI
jgi:hypothetical protein